MHPPYHYFERLTDGGHELLVSGWALWPDGPADRLVWHNRRGEHRDAERVPRPDLATALPWIPHAAAGGFRIAIPMAAMDDAPVHTATMLGVRNGAAIGSVTLRFHRTDAATPLPDAALMEAVALHADPEFFVATGVHTTNDLLAAAAAHRPLAGIRRWLDWGCGCGRQTRFLLERLPHAEGHGADVDAAQVDWLRRHLPRGHYRQVAPQPPMPYADGAFDLVLATSVFTHLRLADHALWMPELRRILAPGGLLLATMHGPAAAAMARLPDIDRALAEHGCFDGLDRPEFAAHGPDSYFRATYQTREHVRDLWSPCLTPVERIAGAVHGIQDLWVLRR